MWFAGRVCASGARGGIVSTARAEKPRPKETDALPTSTPPPYFPQNALSPGDEKTRRRMRLTFYGCVVLLLLGLAGLVAGAVYIIRRLSE